MQNVLKIFKIKENTKEMTPKEVIEEKRKIAEKFVESYIPKSIDKAKFEESKVKQNEFVFTRNEILEETGWKPGTFYNRLSCAVYLPRTTRPGDVLNKAQEMGYYVKVKEAGDKTEKLLFSYVGLSALLQVYFIYDLKCNVKSNSQDNVKEQVNETSTNSQNDSKLNSNEVVLYEQLLREKDNRIASLQKQVEELTNIIKMRDAKELELAKIDLVEKQQQLLINDAEGNRKQSFFARLFSKRKTNESPAK